MVKEDKTPEASSAPEVNPEHIDLDIDTPIEPTQTIEEAEKAASGADTADDEDIYKEASSEVTANEQTEAATKPKKSKKKVFVALLVVLVLAGAGVAAWYFLIYKKPVAQQTATTTETTTNEAASLTYVPETIAYAFRDSEDVPYALFWRPAIGGDRTQVQKLSKSALLSYSDTSGANVAYIDDEKIYVSSDYGKTYALVFESEAGAQITSIKFSSDGSKIAYGYLKDTGEKNIVKSIGLDGKDGKDLFTSNDAGVQILGWSDKQVVYSESCYGCDGAIFTPYSRNLTDNKVTALLEGVDLKVVTAMSASGDLTKLVYVHGVDDGASAEGIEAGTIAPYKIAVVDIVTNKSSDLATVGKAGEENANGTTKYRDIKVGFLAGTVTPYFTDDTTLYTISGDEPNAFYESEKTILFVTFAGEKNIISGSGENTSDYTLSNFDMTTSKSATIFQGDDNTVIFGVTTK